LSSDKLTDDDGISQDFLSNLDELKKKVKKKYQSVDFDGSTDTEREFKKRKPGRRKNRVSDKVENVGTVFSSRAKRKLFVDDPEIIGRIVGDFNSGVKAKKKDLRAKRTRSYRQFNKYIFSDVFGDKSAVFSSNISKKPLNKVFDIQVNCIDEISKAYGKLWRVFGKFESKDYYFSVELKSVGYVYCVGFTNAVILSNILCDIHNCELSYISFIKL